MARSLALVVVSAAAALAAGSFAHGATAGQLCPSFSKSGLTYQWETVGTGWTCTSAKPWIVKLSGDRVAAVAGKVTLKNGPSGFKCYASLTHKGRASGGLCFKGTLAFPKSGFTWNGT